ncbi:energy transducer TonB [Haliea atlantica]|jgi:protein TonB|nr:energy transducer TonB [Haliea sp.]|tara:strand:+ start:5887 stop:6492 length:606 start_codon:yes stop_codon:yes gene_type:complete
MGNRFLRVLIAALVAIPVAVGLFYIMQSLIDREYEQEDVESRKIADIVVPEREIEVNVREQKPEKVEDPEEPPPEMEPMDMDMDMDMDIANVAPRANVNVSISSSGMSSGDGEYLPIVKVAPIYPRRAQTRGITGYCIVEYTVTTSGSTKDIRPVDCQPSGVFESASVKAAEKFKYKPRVVDGTAIEVAGVQNKFTYELED